MSVPAKVSFRVRMSYENWAFGEVRGEPRPSATRLSARPAGTDKPVDGD